MGEIGVKVTEGTANVLSLGNSGAARSIGLAIESVRGVENVPVRVTGLKDTRKIFGGVDASMYSPYVLANLFNNLEGFGIELYLMRVLGISVAASGDISETALEIATFTAGYQGTADKGTWGNGLEIIIYPKGVEGGMVDYILAEVYLDGELVESTYEDTLALLEAKINASSGYVVMAEGSDGYASAFLAEATTGNLTGGTYVAPAESDYEPKYNASTGAPEGLAIFEKTTANILAVPEIFTSAYAVKAELWCRQNDILYVHNLSKDITTSALETFHAAVKTAQVSGMAKNLEWASVDDEIGGRMWIPALGFYIGAGYVRGSALDGDVVWSVPAGSNSYAVGVYEFSHMDLNEVTKERYVTELLTNVVNYSEALGTVIFSSRTCSTNELYHSIHIRLETNWLKKELKSRNLKFIQKLNTTKLRNDMLLDTRAFFKNIYDKGGIENSIAFENAVIISVDTNSDNRKQVDEEIAWIPPETLEYQKITLNRNDGVLNILG